jgi:antitoxin HigA-1
MLKKPMRSEKMKPIHPGEVLSEDYLKPLGMSQNALAKAIGVPADRISEIVRGRRGITGDTAVRLAHYFNTTPELWIGLQADYEIELAGDRLAGELKKMPRFKSKAA